MQVFYNDWIEDKHGFKRFYKSIIYGLSQFQTFFNSVETSLLVLELFIVFST